MNNIANTAKMILTAGFLTLLVACSAAPDGNGAADAEPPLAGAQIGGGRGQLAATAVGALLGAWAGSEVGKSLDKADKLYMKQTSQQALEKNKVGQASTWSNPDSGHSGTVTPTRSYQTAQGDNCREYQQTVTIDGKSERAHGTACRQADGTWRIIK